MGECEPQCLAVLVHAPWVQILPAFDAPVHLEEGEREAERSDLEEEETHGAQESAQN